MQFIKPILSLVLLVSVCSSPLALLTSCATGNSTIDAYINSPEGQAAIKDAQDIAIRVINQIIGSIFGGTRKLRADDPAVGVAKAKARSEIKAAHPQLDERTIQIIVDTAIRARISG